MPESLLRLLSLVRACRECESDLPHGPRPVIQLGRGARLVIIGQAPGSRVHESGIPWQDDSGEHLRSWLSATEAQFYDPSQVALIPMGFCYPGKKGKADAPPRPECAPLWHDRLLGQLPDDALILLVGQYAQARYLGAARKKTLTETVRAYKEYLPRFFPLPHPSWRSKIWMAKNPWFEKSVLPHLRRHIRTTLASPRAR
jgi:uracil-DNA glycosylase